jgi:glycosidase/fibronectin type 3 domain-containing protein
MNHRFHRSGRHAVWALAFIMLGLLAIQPAMTSFATAIDGEVWWAQNHHDSRDPLYRTPGGPIPVGTDVTLRLRTEANDLTSAQVRVWNDRQDMQSFLNMAKVASNGTHDWWEATLDTGTIPNVFWYRFILTDGGDTDFYEDDSRKWGGVGGMFDDSPDNSWAITVYDPAFETPQWVKDAVFYQVFVDRFNDGNPTNNNAAGEFFYNEAGGTIVRSNDTEWNTPVCDPRADTNDTCEGSYSRNFYGGDLQGVIDKLDYLQDLGVTALYLNPIFESPSNHKYDTSDFSVIDDNFGTLADFQNLVAQAELRGMKIVLDGVFNHTSSQSPYFDRYQIHTTVGACESTSSVYEPMYQFIESDPTPTCSDNRDYPYWFGIFDSLPVLDSAGEMARDMVWGDGITHPIGGAKPAVAKYWIDQGAAGWRLDVAPEIDHGILDGDSGNDYWEQFRAAVHSIDPEAYIVGEEWGYSMAWTSGGVEGSVTFPDGNPGEWDATMNYQQSSALLSLWRDTALNAENDFNPGSSAGLLEPYTPSMFVDRYLNLKERYAPEAFAAMMNLLGSHDTQRALWLLDHGHPASPAAGTVHPSSASYDWSDAINRLHGVALMQFTLPGAPQIYYGDEVGLVGQSRFDGSSWQDDPYNRQPYPWLDATGTPFFTHLQSAPAQQANYDYYALLSATRAAHSALRTGEIDFVLTDDANKKLGYLRWMEDGSDAAVVLINRNSTAQNFSIDVGGKVAEGATFDNVLTEGVVESYTVTGGLLNVTGVPANSGVLLVRTSVAVLPPTAVTLSATLGGSQVNLSWNASSGATSYDVYRSTLSGAAYTLLGNTAALTYNDAAIAFPEQYYYIVVAKNDTNGLESAPSNEATILTGYDLSSAYRNVQWPPSLTHTISTENLTENVYAQIWIGGLTDASASPVSGLTAQVGYGPIGSDPTIDDSAWSWFDMVPNPGYNFGQNNDEFQGQMLPTATGTFLYTVRYSGDGGTTWFYATDFNGGSQATCPDQGDNAANNFAKCQLTVNPSSDTTPPTAPAAVKEFDTSSEIGISWSGAADETAISGYRVYRSEEGGAVELVAEFGASATSYTDTDLTPGNAYAYTVRAFDSSFNESADSNTVAATAENSLVDVTFTVTVPEFTPETSVVQVIGGAAQLTNWGAGVDMAATANPNEHGVTLQFEENSTFEYKYRRDGSWDKVEKAANGYDEISNRSFTVGYAENGPYTITDTVANWRDVLVSATDPADDATAVPVTSNIAVSFNKTVNTASDFDVLDAASQPVPGAFTVDNSTAPAITFDPTDNLCPATTYTVNVSGVNAAGDGQQFHSYSFDFTTEADIAVTFNVTVPGFTPAGDVIYLSGNHAALGNDVPNAIAMMNAGSNQWTYTASLPSGSSYTYTYTRGSANTQATAADGETLFSGTVNVAASGCAGQTVADTIGNWVDPMVVSTSPVDGATQQLLNTPISVTFSKPVDPASTFTVEDSNAQPVTGFFIYDGTSNTLTFTPSSNYRSADTITVNVSGVNGAVSGQQTGTYTFSFKTQHVELLKNWDFEGNPAKKKLAPWVLTNGTGDKLICDSGQAYNGQCAFKFKGGPNENSMLLQSVNLTGLTFAPGDELILSAFVDSSPNVNLKLVLTVTYSDTAAQTSQVEIEATSGYQEFTVPALALNSANVTGITVKFKHKSTSGRTFIDDVSLKLRQGNARRGAEMVLPVPNIPSGFRGN